MAFGTVSADVIQSSVANTSLGAGNASIMKNRIINGAMVIDQRNAGASVTINNTGAFQYVVDRFYGYGSVASKFTLQQNAGSVTPPVGFVNYLGATSLSAYSSAAGDFIAMGQEIEGFNIADLGWGTANAKTVTLSFWVRSSLTGTFGGALVNSAQDRSYPYSFSIPVANTWTQISVTIAGDTSGSWLTTNGVGIRVRFNVGCGSTFSGTAGSWQTGNLSSATGATSVVGTNGATFYITGVQLEVGSSATGFEYVNYQTSLANCQRYFVTYTGASTTYLTGQTNGASIFYGASFYTMRGTPTITYNALQINDTGVSNAVTSASVLNMNNASTGFTLTSSGLTAGRCCLVVGTGSTSYLSLSAEL